MKVGYAWVSIDDQQPEAQADRLKTHGCERVFIDKGENGHPQWDKCLEQLRKGDTLVVVHLDRLLGGSVRDIASVLDILNDLDRRGVRVRVIDRFIPEYHPSGFSFLRWWKRT
jgi:DNA invertase Pin-like site-specific DNA recombinase